MPASTGCFRQYQAIPTSSSGSRMGRKPTRLKIMGHQLRARRPPLMRAARGPASRRSQRMTAAIRSRPRENAGIRAASTLSPNNTWNGTDQ